MKLPRLSGMDIIKAFGRCGYSINRQHGSHIILEKQGFPSLSIPNHRELDNGTLRAIIRKSGMDIKTFTTLLR